MVDKYEDPFVRIASMIGGDEYLKVARSLLKAEDATDEEIASSTGLRINMVRKVLYDLFGKSLITGIRVKDERKGWFVYRWRSRRDEVENFIENQKKKIQFSFFAMSEAERELPISFEVKESRSKLDQIIPSGLDLIRSNKNQN